MEKKQLQLIKSTLKKSGTIIPIIENVLIADDFITVTDLEVTLNIPYKYSDVPVCVSAVKFITAMEMMPEAKITSQRMDENTDKVTLTHGTKKIGITGDNHKNYPKTPSPLPGTTTPGLKHIGYLGAETLKHMNIALTFVSKDDLRPAMTGIYFNKKTIASTDAHRMYWNKIPKLDAEFIMPARAAKILLQAGGGYEVYYRPEINTPDKKDADGKVIKPGKHSRSLCTLVRTDGLVISFYPIDARYPNYKVVIPKVTPETSYFLLNKKELVKELGAAIKYANPATCQVVFSLNGKTTIHSECIDFGQEYDSELQQTEIKGDDIIFAINGKFLSEVVALSESDTIKINYFTPSKAFIVNDSFLIMPLMLNN